jgi:hypothetical protein
VYFDVAFGDQKLSFDFFFVFSLYREGGCLTSTTLKVLLVQRNLLLSYSPTLTREISDAVVVKARMDTTSFGSG